VAVVDTGFSTLPLTWNEARQNFNTGYKKAFPLLRETHLMVDIPSASLESRVKFF
jgi:hypothetical protein